MATVKKAISPIDIASSKLVPAVPETSGASVAKKRRRLAKAFSRPLDKKLRGEERISGKFSLLAGEYAQLVDLKRRLAAQGVDVKKGELLRAGVLMLASFDDGEFLAALEKLQVTA